MTQAPSHDSGIAAISTAHRPPHPRTRMVNTATRIHDAALRLYAEKGAAQLTISELADAAGVARGTVYSYISSPEALREQVAVQLANEMYTRVQTSFGTIDDPAQRLANAVRFFIQRAHAEPLWGRFFARFVLTEAPLQALWTGPATVDARRGIAIGRYNIREDQLIGAMSLLAGTVVSAMHLVLEGHRTWRDAGSDAAELVLRAFGVSPSEAHKLASGELPAFPTGDATPS